MFKLVTGGSGSGKSAFAEDQILTLGDGQRIYIATMFPYDEESFARIDRHRAMRADKGFITIECYRHLAGLTVPKGSHVLLECMSNLVANEMFQPEGAKENTVEAVISGVQNVLTQTEHLVIVTNEIASDGMQYDPDTVRYQKYLGEINRYLGHMADEAYEVVYGIPVRLL